MPDSNACPTQSNASLTPTSTRVPEGCRPRTRRAASWRWPAARRLNHGGPSCTHRLCLGRSGGKTYKLKFGHHGANHPVMDLGTNKVEITSQNHGFAVDVGSLEGRAVLSHVSLNDRTVEGMRHERLPVFSVQYHPEASPGPNDASYLFDRFVGFIDGR